MKNITEDHRGYAKFAGWKKKEPHGLGRFFGATKTPVATTDGKKFMVCALDREPLDKRLLHLTIHKHAFFNTAKEASDCAYDWYSSLVGAKKQGDVRPARSLAYAEIPATLLSPAEDAVPETVAITETAMVADSSTSPVLDGKRGLFAAIMDLLRRSINALFSLNMPPWAKPKSQVQ